jgi:hypothetical protein
VQVKHSLFSPYQSVEVVLQRSWKIKAAIFEVKASLAGLVEKRKD